LPRPEIALNHRWIEAKGVPVDAATDRKLARDEAFRAMRGRW
jgi:hypothetical protein